MRYLWALLVIALTATSSGAGFVKIDLPTKADIDRVYFADQLYGWATTSQGELLATRDGGKTWTAKKVSNRSINDISMKGHWGYLTGKRGLLMKTIDRGATWRDISLNIKFDFSRVQIVNDSVAFICGTDQNSISKDEGVLFVTDDYGKTWAKKEHYGNGYADMIAIPAQGIYLLADKQILHSSSGKDEFTGTEHKSHGRPRSFAFVDSCGYMVGDKGYLAISTAYGKKWTPLVSGTENNLMAIRLLDSSSGVIAGQSGTILLFYDYGQRIVKESCDVKTDFLTVCITNSKIFCGGRKGVLLCRSR